MKIPKTVLGAIGVILCVAGLTAAIPFLTNKMYFAGGLALAVEVIGIILIAFAFAEDEH